MCKSQRESDEQKVHSECLENSLKSFLKNLKKGVDKRRKLQYNCKALERDERERVA